MRKYRLRFSLLSYLRVRKLYLNEFLHTDLSFTPIIILKIVYLILRSILYPTKEILMYNLKKKI